MRGVEAPMARAGREAVRIADKSSVELIAYALANSLGFPALYMTGYGAVASSLGVPDAGLASVTEMLDRVRCIAASITGPLIADGPSVEDLCGPRAEPVQARARRKPLGASSAASLGLLRARQNYRADLLVAQRLEVALLLCPQALEASDDAVGGETGSAVRKTTTFEAVDQDLVISGGPDRRRRGHLVGIDAGHRGRCAGTGWATRRGSAGAPVRPGRLALARRATSCRRHHRDGQYEIYVMNRDGSGLRRLTNHPERDDYAAWHPDGRRLVTVSERDGRFDLYLLDMVE